VNRSVRVCRIGGVELDDPAAKERLPSSADPVPGAAELAIFAALADPTRWSVLETVLSAGTTSATRLANRLPVSRQAVVKHLHVLEGPAWSGAAEPAARCATWRRPARWRSRPAGLPGRAVVPVLEPAVPDGRLRGPRR
jgi:hypothetical protein